MNADELDEIYALAGDIARLSSARLAIREAASVSLDPHEARDILGPLDRALDRLRAAWESKADALVKEAP